MPRLRRNKKKVFIARKKIHFEFDLLWQEKLMSRHLAYFYLQYLLGIIDPNKAHISLLTQRECRELKKKMRQSYMLHSFFRFLAMTQYIPPKRRKHYADQVVKASNPMERLCRSCYRFKNVNDFWSKKRCNECKTTNKPKTEKKFIAPRWIGTPDFMERLAKGEISHLPPKNAQIASFH